MEKFRRKKTTSLVVLIFYFHRPDSVTGAWASSLARIRDHTQTHTTLGTTPLDD
jgi:hypothetical protein